MDYSLSTGARLDNQTLYDDGEIQVQLGGITGTPTSPQFVLAIKNGRRKTIDFVPQHCIINGWQTDCWADVYEVEGHSTITATVSISSGLELVQPSDVSTVQLDFDLYDTNYDLITSLSNSFSLTDEPDESSYMPDGEMVHYGQYEAAFSLTHNTYDGSANLCAYIENNTERTIYVTTSKAKLNGESVEYLFFEDVMPHARRLSSDAIYDPDSYDSLELGDDDTLSFTLLISDEETGVQMLSQDVSLTGSQLH